MDFLAYPLWANMTMFAVSGAIVWFAGTKLSGQVDELQEKTGIGEAFLGMLLLGGITSLPEVATVSTASINGNASLAVNNLLGSVAINIVLLAVADAMIRRDALTSVVAGPSTLLQGTLNILLLAVVTAGIVIGDVAFFGLGVASGLTLPLFLFALWLSAKYAGRQPLWVHTGRREELAAELGTPDAGRSTEHSLRAVIGLITVTSLAILVAGYALAKTGDAIAEQSGLGAGLVGLVLVGFATSLPEISTITASVRMRRYELAIGDIFGTNLFDVALIFLADLLYSGPPVLREVGTFEAVATLLGIILTTLYLLGLLERQDRSVLRMGYDSLAVILTYAGGVAVLYFLSASG